MGKSSKNNSKANVKKNIFKVAGCKSLAAKNKAKSVTAERLKKLSLKNRQKIDRIDEQFVNLNADIRQPVKIPEPVSNKNLNNNNHSTNTEKYEKIRKYNETQKNCEQALDKFCSMEM